MKIYPVPAQIKQTLILFCFTALYIGCTFLSPHIAAGSSNFPVYSAIRPHVEFWEKVYATYTTNQGILHDKDNPAIIYGVVDLIDWNLPGSARMNKKLIKLAREHYKTILSKLGSGKNPSSNDEKKIHALFKKYRKTNYKRARSHIRLQIGQSDRFLKGVIRSGRHMNDIKKIFRSYNLPSELAYLPHVESSFNPKARSKAGASGLWQFTRPTGKAYMTINYNIDERLDPYKATRAAARFLKKNHERLKSWPVALTAYNHGPAGMARALRKHKGYENIFKYYKSKRFGFASKNFYSEFLAALKVAKKLESSRGVILDRPEALLSLRLKGFVAARDMRSHFRISREDFKRLNPALLSPVLNGSKYIPKDFELKLPASDRTRKLAKNIPSKIYHKSQIRDNYYVVKRGDTISALAKRYKIKKNELIRHNNLNKRASIRVGQKLSIPGRPLDSRSSHITVLRGSSKNRPKK